MSKHTAQSFKNICPRNCPSSCTMVSLVENNRLVHLTGDPNHPYTRGKLCAKGFSYIEKNSHPERLKYPYYQKIKGSGKFKQISWEYAYELIINEMKKIHERTGSFLPFAFYKGSGNIGVHHYVTDEFFASMGETTRLIGSSFLFNEFDHLNHEKGKARKFDPTTIAESSLIIIWGANPAATNIHLIYFIIEAKMKGAKIVVIDPLHTQTVELADLYIQLQPNTDKELAHFLNKYLIEKNIVDRECVDNYTLHFNDYTHMLENMNTEDLLKKCDIKQEALDKLLRLLTKAKSISYVVGTGLKKQVYSDQTLQAIQALAAISGDIGKTVGGIFSGYNDTIIFNNQSSKLFNRKQRIISTHERAEFLFSKQQPSIEMLWISCGNPLTQEPNPAAFQKLLETTPFVVTVEQFLTPTAQMSNLVLPTTTHFEEMDIIVSAWHGEIALNEKALSPYYECKSEWSILTELAQKLKQQTSLRCSFPIFSSEEEYLDAQFNDKVVERFSVKNTRELKERLMTASFTQEEAQNTEQFFSPLELDQNNINTLSKTDLQSLLSDDEGDFPTETFPFWLLTPHHPYTFNSQFHYLNLSDEGEAFVGIHPKVAKELDIIDGEIINVYNNQASIQIKAVYSYRVPKDIIMIYQGWYPSSQVTINNLISELQTINKEKSAPYKGIAFNNTFVNVQKLY